MREDALSVRLAGGEPMVALFAKMPCTAQIESAGYTGFDLVIIDQEHGPGGSLELEHHLRAARSVGLPALVRVSSARADSILTALDAGADGIVVPHVLDAEGAEAAVVAAHYPPRGRRGLATSTRAGRYGATSLEEHLLLAAETCVVVQIEDAEAVSRSVEILAVPGVSGALIGTSDLSVSLGHPGDLVHPEVVTAIAAIIAAAGRAGVPVLAVAGSPSGVTAWRGQGAAVVALVAASLIHAAFTDAIREAKPGGQATGLRTGGREELVLLPGMFGDASLWDEVAPRLVDHAATRIGRIDLDDSIGEMAESVLATGPERFAVAGHSLGAIVALELVRRAPHRITRLALINASARPPSEAQLAAWSQARERIAAGEFDEVASELALEALPDRQGLDGSLSERVLAMAGAFGAGALSRQLAAQVARPDSRLTLVDINVPTLVLSGAQDEVCPVSLQEEVAAGIRDAEHVTIAEAGHMTPLESPEALAGHLIAWLRR